VLMALGMTLLCLQIVMQIVGHLMQRTRS